ncbi:MAG TPA: sugar phosphate isomerase/epimerase, partial [Longimicrobiales bacterium]|nr:sugar phosphate isomerase/epimerase [Longimicrobiales bacterium]
MDRRQFIGTAALGAAGLAIGGCGGGAPSSAPAASMQQARRLERIGLQLYTVRTRLAQDFSGTLEAIAELGYTEVETAGLHGHPAEHVRGELDRLGLVSPAAHVQIGAMRNDLDAVFAEAETLGQHYVIVPVVNAPERTAEGFRNVAAELNRFGQEARARGLRIGYHNHDYEFAALDGNVTGFDILLGDTDPDLVDFELDLYWAIRAGHDPLHLFSMYPGRFKLCHVKDMADGAGSQAMADVGQGEIDFAAIFARSEEAGLQHYFVEHD